MAIPTTLAEQAPDRTEQDQLWDEAFALAKIASAAVHVGRTEEVEMALNEQAHLLEQLKAMR